MPRLPVTCVALSRCDLTCWSGRQLSPFPFDEVKAQLDLYPADADIVWSQEEAKNNGPWAYIEPRFETTAAKAKVIRSVIAKTKGPWAYIEPRFETTAAKAKVIRSVIAKQPPWAYIQPRFETTAAKAKVIRSVIAKV